VDSIPSILLSRVPDLEGKLVRPADFPEINTLVIFFSVSNTLGRMAFGVLSDKFMVLLFCPVLTKLGKNVPVHVADYSGNDNVLRSNLFDICHGKFLIFIQEGFFSYTCNTSSLFFWWALGIFFFEIPLFSLKSLVLGTTWYYFVFLEAILRFFLQFLNFGVMNLIFFLAGDVVFRSYHRRNGVRSYFLCFADPWLRSFRS
jgi:hypothetical protein